MRCDTLFLREVRGESKRPNLDKRPALCSRRSANLGCLGQRRGKISGGASEQNRKVPLSPSPSSASRVPAQASPPGFFHASALPLPAAEGFGGGTRGPGRCRSSPGAAGGARSSVPTRSPRRGAGCTPRHGSADPCSGRSRRRSRAMGTRSALRSGEGVRLLPGIWRRKQRGKRPGFSLCNARPH